MIEHEPGTYNVEQKVSIYLYKFGHKNISAPSFLHVEKIFTKTDTIRNGIKADYIKG